MDRMIQGRSKENPLDLFPMFEYISMDDITYTDITIFFEREQYLAILTCLPPEDKEYLLIEEYNKLIR